MDFLQPTSWADALAARAERPDAVPIAGGTDVMVDLNFDRRRPGALLDLGRVPELREWTAEDGWIRLGAGVPYARIIDDLRAAAARAGHGLADGRLPADPHPRHGRAGTSGSASPAGDAHPPLLAADAVVEVASAARGTRRIPVGGVLHRGEAQRPGRGRADRGGARAPGGRAAAVLQGRHPQRDGHRGLGVRLRAAPRPAGGRHRHRLGRTHAAPGSGGRGLPGRRAARPPASGSPAASCPDALARAFGERVAAAASPIDDVRGSAAYRRHSLSVMARRAATWAWNDLRKAA